MQNLNEILQELETVDADLAIADAWDLGRIAAVLERRNRLIGEATAAIDALRQPTAEQQIALRRSREAGVSAMRQLILAKHLLSSEIASLKQEQRLWDTVSAQVRPSAPPRVDWEG
ncbi:MAG: hypothetical protein JNK48_27980 [Bryobacterales bacterium]|nr:hypothetical protein [Bryobacterales bacterium]